MTASSRIVSHWIIIIPVVMPHKAPRKAPCIDARGNGNETQLNGNAYPSPSTVKTATHRKFTMTRSRNYA